MKTTLASKGRCAAVLFITVVAIIGCNNQAGTSDSTNAGAVLPRLGHVRHLQDLSTAVKVFNHEETTITGVVPVTPCWSVSPYPLPSASASPGHTPKITETYDTGCPTGNNSITLQYTTTGVTCNFQTTYNSGSAGFTYAAYGYSGNCLYTPAPPSDDYNEKFIYGRILGGAEPDGQQGIMRKSRPR